MTSQQQKCGLGSLLPMSCRQGTEAFANSLRSRLKSLDSDDKSEPINENGWISSQNHLVALAQPKHNSENIVTTNLYLNLVSPGSPAEETDASEGTFINVNSYGKNISLQYAHCDSDSSDGPFYDCCGDLNQSLEGTSKNEYPANIHPTSLKVNKEIYDSSKNPAAHITNLASDTLESINKKETTLLQVCSEPAKFFFNEPDGENETADTIPRVRRSSSLKTGKTPPGTPGHKKIVRFADVLGLDLADVRTFLDEIPKIPNSAFNDLLDINMKPVSSLVLNTSLESYDRSAAKLLVPTFKQPGGQPNFIDRVRERQVCLDSALIDDSVTLSIKGIVRVKNLDFHKTVHVRYTLDSWQSFADVQATYVENSCDGFSDKFSFILFASNLTLDQKLEFAIRFQCKGCQYWDNNNGTNYCFQSLPSANQHSNAILTLSDNNETTVFQH